MKITKKSKQIARGLTAGFAGLLAVSIGASTLVTTYRADLDKYSSHTRFEFIPDSIPSNALDLYNHTVPDNVEVDGVKFDVTKAKGVVEYSRALSEKLAGEGQVLMKNDNNALPLKGEDKKIALLGARSYMNAFSGSMGSVTNVSEATPLPQALKDQGFTIVDETDKAYQNAYVQSIAKDVALTDEEKAALKIDKPNAGGNQDACGSGFGAVTAANYKGYQTFEPTVEALGLKAKSQKSGVAVVTVGRRSQEAGYYLPGAAGKAAPTKGNKNGTPARESTWEEEDDCLALTIQERAIIKYAKDNYAKVILLVNSDCAMDIDEVFKGGKSEVDAVLWTGLPGAYGFKATAKILDGTINPSGGLADTYEAKSSITATGQNVGYFEFANIADQKTDPDAYKLQQGSEKSLWYEAENEGIYSGYKYDETRYFDLIANPSSKANSKKGAFNGTAWNYKDDVARAFGYGLSYTQFKEEIVELNVDQAKRTVSAKIKVTNTGSTAGKHNVQLYVSVPDSNKARVQKSAIQLIDFGKTALLQPNASETIELTDISFEKFASWDSDFAHDGVKGGYVLEAGDYYFTTGNDQGAHGAVNNVLLEMGKSGLIDADGTAVTTKTSDVKKVALARVEITQSVKGALLSNQLEDMDPTLAWNLKLLSRTDWDGTFPERNSGLKSTAAMEDGLRCDVYKFTENDNNGQTVVWNAQNGLTIDAVKPAKGVFLEYDDPNLIALVQNVTLDEALRNLQCAGGSTFIALTSIGMNYDAYQNDGPMGFDGNDGAEQTCLFGDRNPANTVYDTDDTNADADNATDTWGKIAMRPMPTNVVVGSTFNKELVEESGECIGIIGLWVGNMAIWGPGSNIHRTPYNTRNHEYYSEDPILLGVMTDVYSKGGKSMGLTMAPKHYAFNDYDLNRSGIAPFLTEQDARENALRGFQYAFESENAMASMGAFGRAGAYFCSAHPGLMSGILRTEWAWNGFFVTDMVNPGYYMNARDSIAVGTDGMLTGASQAVNGWIQWNPIAEADTNNAAKGPIARSEVEKDMYFQQCLQDSIHRYLWAILNSNYVNGMVAGQTVEHKAAYDVAAESAVIGTAVLTGLSAVAYCALAVLGKED